MRRALVLVLGACTVGMSATWAACGSEQAQLTPSSVRVDILTDYAPGLEFDEVVVALEEQRISVVAQPGQAWVPAISVGSLSLAPGAHTLAASLRNHGADVVARPVDVEVTGATAVEVALTRSCADVACSAPAACHAGTCVDAKCSNLAPSACGEAECSARTDCPPSSGCLVAQCRSSVCLAIVDDLRCADDEHCDPTSGCVPDAVSVMSCDGQEAGTTCRPAAGACDSPEVCDGVSAECPADSFLTAGVVCRAATDTCDREETCSGTSAHCPLDAVAAANTPCGTEPTEPCDRADVCDGVSKKCYDAVQSFGIVCRERADFDVPLNPGGCDIAESCNGVSKECPPDAREPPTKICRAASPTTAPTCDVQELCGGANRCPPDAVKGNGTLCDAASASVCDADDYCDGVSKFCPESYLVGNVCRAAVGDGCDVAEICSGLDADCPADAKRPAGYQCRAAGGICGVAEYCDGASNSCPADQHRPSGTSCGGSTCHTSGTCTGTSPTMCSGEGQLLPAGTPCPCSGDRCGFCSSIGTCSNCSTANCDF